MQYIACCRHLCTLLAFCSSSKSGADNTVTSPRPLYQHQIPETRLPIRMPAFDFKKYWIYVSTNQSFDRFGKQITLCESLLSFSQFLPEPDTGLLNLTSLRKPLNSACPTLHKPLKTPIRCLRTPHLHDTFDKAIHVIRFRSPIFYSGSFYRNQATVYQSSLSYDNRRILMYYSAQTFKKPTRCLSTTLTLRNPGQRRLEFKIPFANQSIFSCYRVQNLLSENMWCEVNRCQRMAVWLVRDCGLFTYQVIVNFEAGYYAPKTTETLINYTACCQQYFYL